jgi:DNA-binding transcriptional ArsR family regulator
MTSTINLLRLLADPTRLRLLLLLEEEELSVAELQEILGMGQPRISSHLAQLKRAGAVDDRRAGKNVYYGPAKNRQTNGVLPVNYLKTRPGRWPSLYSLLWQSLSF